MITYLCVERVFVSFFYLFIIFKNKERKTRGSQTHNKQTTKQTNNNKNKIRKKTLEVRKGEYIC